MFWTDSIPQGSVEIDFDEGEAELRIRNLCVLDTFTTANSNDQTHPMGPPVAAVIDSLKLNWSGIRRKVLGFHSTDPQEKFAGDFIENSATIEVTATTLPSTGHGFRFVSDPAHTTISNFAQIGKEQNGAFA